MKDAKTIISHLKKNPLLNNLQKKECFSLLLGLLPKNFAIHVKFLYVKNDTLFFVLSHQSAKMEFNYKRNLIKGLLKQITNLHVSCDFSHIKEVKSFISNKEMPKLHETQTTIFYPERADGAFKNLSNDPKLYVLFEKIREEILCSKKN
ncbi:MAG: hypothetical protein IBX44_06045 [Sulfurospirillum sp.]|nr:hypothetical protein [Sulfurospirillum sp.]